MRSWMVFLLIAVILAGAINDAYAGPKPKKPDVTVEGVTDTTIEVSWTQQTPPSVDEFRAEIREKGGGVFVVDAVLPSTTFSHTYAGLTPETTYEVKITACNVDGCSSSQKEKTTLSASLPESDKKGGGCSDCVPPTLGVQHKTFKKIVSGGFTYNNQTADVDYYHTEFPLVNTTVNEENLVTLKIYEDRGHKRIKHVGIGFGLEKGQFASESENYISVSFDHNGNTTVKILGNISNVSVVVGVADCGIISVDCLKLDIYHTFTSALEGMVVTNVWDTRLNSWQNFFNGGIRAIDLVEFKVMEPAEIIEEKITNNMFGDYKRGNSVFEEWKKIQAERARQTFISLYGDIYNFS